MIGIAVATLGFWLGAGEERRVRVHRRRRRADHRLPVRARPRDADGAAGRHRPRRAARAADQGPGGPRVDPPGRHDRARQDRHRDDRPHEPRRRRARRRTTDRAQVAAAGRRARGRLRAPDRTGDRRAARTRRPVGEGASRGDAARGRGLRQPRGPRRRGRRRRARRRRRPARAAGRLGDAPDARARGRARRAPSATAAPRSRPAGTARRARVLVVADTVKPTSAEAVARLKALGLRPVLLTGDNADDRARGRRRGRDRRGDRRGAPVREGRRRAPAAGRGPRRRDGRRRRQRRARRSRRPTSAWRSDRHRRRDRGVRPHARLRRPARRRRRDPALARDAAHDQAEPRAGRSATTSPRCRSPRPACSTRCSRAPRWRSPASPSSRTRCGCAASAPPTDARAAAQGSGSGCRFSRSDAAETDHHARARCCRHGVATPAAARAPTAATLREEIRVLLDARPAQWAGMMTPAGDFANPFPADLARGHGSFVPPMLAYALHRAGQRRRSALVAAAERAWPRSVDPVRASAFDMVGAATRYRLLPLSDARRAQLADYMSRYGIPLNGYRCLSVPHVLLEPAAGRRARGARDHRRRRRARPTPRRGCAIPSRRARPPRTSSTSGSARVVDHGVRARIGAARMRGSLLSDPPAGPDRLPRAVDVHAVRGDRAARPAGVAARRGARAASARHAGRARRARRRHDLPRPRPGPDLGTRRSPPARWRTAPAPPRRATRARAARYLAVAQRAVQRLAALHASPHGLRLVPRRRGRRPMGSTATPTRSPTTASRCSASRPRSTRSRRSPPRAIGRLPADRRLDRRGLRAERARRRLERAHLAGRAPQADGRQRPALRLRRARAQAAHRARLGRPARAAAAHAARARHHRARR